MGSYFNLIEQLESYVEEMQCIGSSSLEDIRGASIAISGSFLLKCILQSDLGNILVGFSEKSLQQKIHAFDCSMKECGIKYKIVFDGATLFSNEDMFKNASRCLANLYHKLWKLEVFNTLYEETDNVTTHMLSEEIRVARAMFGSSVFTRAMLSEKYQDMVINILDLLKIEYLIAPQDANRQLAWFYAHDYCEAVATDFGAIAFTTQLPQIIIGIDFKEKTFKFADSKQFSIVVGAQHFHESRIYELWAFYKDYTNLEPNDIALLECFDASIMDVKQKMADSKLKGRATLISNLETLNLAISSQKKNNSDEEFMKVYESKGVERAAREHAISLIDLRQVMNSSCELAYYPQKSKMKITSRDKTRSQITLDYHKCPKNYTYYCFGILDKNLLTVGVKASKYTYYVPPPSADSEEIRGLIDSFLRPFLEGIIAEMISTYPKIYLIYDFFMDGYYLQTPTKLEIKDKAKEIEQSRKSPYFSDSAIAEWESISGQKCSSSLQDILAVYFAFLTAVPESSALKLSELQNREKKEEEPPKLSDSEIYNLIFFHLLDKLGFISISEKRFLIAGAGLMRKGSKEFEDKTLLLLVLLMQGVLNGRFMNPPDRKLLKARAPKDDLYLIDSLRKTSTEIRKRGSSPIESLDDSAENLLKNRKDSEYVVLKQNEFLREISVYDCEKTVNSISLEINNVKTKFYLYCEQNKLILDDQVDILANGLSDESIPKIILVSRIFSLITSEIEFSAGKGAIVDFDTSQFLDIVHIVQKTIHLKVQSLFYACITRGRENPELADLIRLKGALPFGTCYSTHTSNLIKVILTRFVAYKGIGKVCSPEYKKKLEEELTLTNILEEFSQYKSLQKDLLSGFLIFENTLEILKYGVERGIKADISPMIKLWMSAYELLKECFNLLNILN